MRHQRGLAALLAAACAAGCAGPARPPARDERLLERGARLVRLTSTGCLPARVVVPAGADLVLFSEREDGPVAVVLRGDGGPRALTPVPLGPGEAVSVRCDHPGELRVEVHPAEGPSSHVQVVVGPRG